MITITAQPGMLGDEGDLPHEVQLLCAYKWWGYNGSITVASEPSRVFFPPLKTFNERCRLSSRTLTIIQAYL